MSEAVPQPQSRQQALACAVLAVLLTLAAAWILQAFIRPLVWAAILAIAVEPLYVRVRRLHPPRGHDVMIPLAFTVATVAVVLVPMVFAGVQLARESHTWAAWAHGAAANGIGAPAWLEHLPVVGGRLVEWWGINLADPDGARALAERLPRDEALGFGRNVGAALVHRAVQFGFTVVALFFLLRDREVVTRQCLTACNRMFGPRGDAVARRVVASVHGTVDGMVLVSIGVGLLLGMGYWLFGAPHPALLGAATAVAAVVPMGSPIVLAIAVLLVISAGHTGAAIALAVIGMAIIFAADHFVRPVLIGGATKLPFLLVMLGMLGGVETLGLLGLFVGPAVMAALMMLWREFTDARAASQAI